MSTFSHMTGLQVLEFIKKQRLSYSKNNLSKIIWREFKGFSIQQTKDILSQLMDKGYLKEINVGISFAMIVIVLTEKGKEAVNSHDEIALDFKRFYNEPFKPAADMGVVDKDTLEEYYSIKRELVELQKVEEELKDTIKSAMREKGVNELHSEFMDLYYKKAERVIYPKEKIEKYVPSDILNKIRTVNESIILITKLKTKKEVGLQGANC